MDPLLWIVLHNPVSLRKSEDTGCLTAASNEVLAPAESVSIIQICYPPDATCARCWAVTPTDSIPAVQYPDRDIATSCKDLPHAALTSGTC